MGETRSRKTKERRPTTRATVLLSDVIIAPLSISVEVAAAVDNVVVATKTKQIKA